MKKTTFRVFKSGSPTCDIKVGIPSSQSKLSSKEVQRDMNQSSFHLWVSGTVTWNYPLLDPFVYFKGAIFDTQIYWYKGT